MFFKQFSIILDGFSTYHFVQWGNWDFMSFDEFRWLLMDFEWFWWFFDGKGCFSMFFNLFQSFSMFFNLFESFWMFFNAFQSFSVLFNVLSMFFYFFSMFMLKIHPILFNWTFIKTHWKPSKGQSILFHQNSSKNIEHTRPIHGQSNRPSQIENPDRWWSTERMNSKTVKSERSTTICDNENNRAW